MRWSGNLCAARCHASLAILLLVFLAVTEVHAGRRKRDVDLLNVNLKQAKIAKRAVPSSCSYPAPAGQPYCCPNGIPVQPAENGGLGSCCPVGQQPLDNGDCCPPDTDPMLVDNPSSILPQATTCCPTGEKWDCSKQVCCPADEYSLASGCCPAGTAYTSNLDGSIQCCSAPASNRVCYQGLGDPCDASSANSCPSTLTCYRPAGSVVGYCLLKLLAPCLSDAECAAYSPDQFIKTQPIACRLALLAPDALSEGATSQQYEQAVADTIDHIPTCTSFYTDNGPFGRCNPNDPNACNAVSTSPQQTCTRLSYNGDYACLQANGTPCRAPGTTAQLVGDPGNGNCASGNCDPISNKCAPLFLGPFRARRRDFDDKPAVLEKSGQHRILLRPEEAIAMIAGHGVFRYQGRSVQDTTFMRARSLWKRAGQKALLAIRTYQPDLFVDLAMRGLSRKERQFALSDNVKIWSGDAPYIIRGLLDDPHFVAFDWQWVRVDRAGLQALYDRLNVTVPGKSLPTRTFEQEM